MNVSDAITARHSTRAFRPDPISADEVRDMLSIAARAPSGGNLQPWMVHVIAGDAIAEDRIVGSSWAMVCVPSPCASEGIAPMRSHGAMRRAVPDMASPHPIASVRRVATPGQEV